MNESGQSPDATAPAPSSGATDEDWATLGDCADGGAWRIPPSVRAQHLYVLGRTGTGKSTMLARLALSDIARGDGLMVLDPHGDLVEDIIDNCPEEHLERLIYLNPADREHPVPFNLFDCDEKVNKDTVCSEVVGVFKRLYGDSWGPQLEDLLRSLTLAMLDHQLAERVDVIDETHRYNATLKEAYDFLFDQRFRVDFYDYIENDMVRRYWRDFYDNIGRSRSGSAVTWDQIKYSSSTTNKLRRFLLNPLVFHIVCNRDRRNTLDLRRVMDDGRVLLVNLSKGALGEDNSQLIGSMLLSRLVVASLARGDTPTTERKQFHLIADEFQAFATDSFKLLLSEARKYGVTITIAHQHREQIDYEMRGATVNCGSTICFRLTGRDAEDVCREFDSTPQQRGWRPDPDVEIPDEEIGLILARETAEGREPHALLVAWATLRKREVELNAWLTGVRHRLDEVWRLERGASLHPQEEDVEKRVDIALRLAETTAAKLAIKRELGELDPTRYPWARSDRQRLVADKPTYAEQEREIANQLTQLPNYTAMARLADGSQLTATTRPLFPASPFRERLVDSVLKATRRDYAIAPESRASLKAPQYFTRLRRDEARVYDSEVEDAAQPETPSQPPA